MNESGPAEIGVQREKPYILSVLLFSLSLLSFILFFLLLTRIGEYLQWPYLVLAFLLFPLPPIVKKLRLGRAKNGGFFELCSIAFSGSNFFVFTYFLTVIPVVFCFSGWVVLLAAWLLIRK